MMTSSTIEMLPDDAVSQRNSGTPNHAYYLSRHSTSTLSMRNKKHKKRQATAHHNSNFHAGYVPVTEDALQRTGIRGRKRYFLYCTMGVLMFLAVVNLLITIWLLHIIGMTQEGTAGFELLKTGSGLVPRFFSSVVFSSLMMKAAPLGARYNSSLKIDAQNTSLYLNSHMSSMSSQGIMLNNNSIVFKTEHLKFKTSNRNDWTYLDINFITSNPAISTFHVPQLITPEVQNGNSPDDDIHLESYKNHVFVNGSLGVEMTSSSGHIVLNSKDVTLDAERFVIIRAKHGVYFQPSVTPNGNTMNTGNKLCICDNGRLFLVPVSSSKPRRRPPCKIGKKLMKKICR